MTGGINVNKTDGINAQPNIFSQVESKENELKNNSIFQSLGTKTERYTKETAFLLSIFDKDNSGNITKAEIDAVNEDDYNQQLGDYNRSQAGDKRLTLNFFKDTKAELQRRVDEESNIPADELPKRGFLAALETATTADADINGAEPYYDDLVKTSELEKKTELSTDEQKLLKTLKMEIQLSESIMSPEAVKQIKGMLPE